MRKAQATADSRMLQHTLVEQQIGAVGQHVLLLDLEHVAVIKSQPAARIAGMIQRSN